MRLSGSVASLSASCRLMTVSAVAPLSSRFSSSESRAALVVWLKSGNQLVRRVISSAWQSAKSAILGRRSPGRRAPAASASDLAGAGT